MNYQRVLLKLGEGSLRTGLKHINAQTFGHNRFVFSSSTYEEAKDWLLEDEYEPVEGRLFSSDL